MRRRVGAVAAWHVVRPLWAWHMTVTETEPVLTSPEEDLCHIELRPFSDWTLCGVFYPGDATCTWQDPIVDGICQGCGCPVCKSCWAEWLEQFKPSRPDE